MLPYRLLIQDTAGWFMSRLDEPTRKLLSDALFEIAHNPFKDEQVLPLVGHDVQLTKHIGSCTVMLNVNYDSHTVEVIECQYT